MNGLGKGSVEKGFAIPPGKRSRLESFSLAVVITVIKQSTRSWHRHGSRSLELCFWHGARALGGAGQLLWRVRRSVLQRALPSELLGQCRALREAEGKLMAARTWARTGTCGLSPVFPAGLGTPRSRTCTKGTRGSFSRLGAGLLEPHLHPLAEQQGCSQSKSQTGGGPESCSRTVPFPPVLTPSPGFSAFCGDGAYGRDLKSEAGGSELWGNLGERRGCFSTEQTAAAWPVP